jgi:hypothetical protein
MHFTPEAAQKVWGCEVGRIFKATGRPVRGRRPETLLYSSSAEETREAKAAGDEVSRFQGMEGVERAGAARS